MKSVITEYTDEQSTYAISTSGKLTFNEYTTSSYFTIREKQRLKSISLKNVTINRRGKSKFEKLSI